MTGVGVHVSQIMQEFLRLAPYFSWCQLISKFTLLSRWEFNPLHWAARGGHGGAVKYLIQAGADVDIKDNIGVSE